MTLRHRVCGFKRASQRCLRGLRHRAGEPSGEPAGEAAGWLARPACAGCGVHSIGARALAVRDL